MEHKIANDILFEEVDRLLSAGSSVRLTPTGSSMVPFIRGGSDSVIIERASEPRRGDILLVRLGREHYVMHRLIAVSGDSLTLRGDGNIAGEEHCRRSDVIGRVSAVYTASGHKRCTAGWRTWQWLFPMRRWLLKAYRKIQRLRT